MTLIGTKTLTASDIIAHEYRPDIGACREQLVFDNSTAQTGLGAVLISTDSGATWAALNSTQIDDGAGVEVAALIAADGTANTATRLAFIIGDEFGGGNVGITATEKVLCITKGVAGIRKANVTYEGTVNASNTAALQQLMDAVMPLVTLEDSVSATLS